MRIHHPSLPLRAPCAIVLLCVAALGAHAGPIIPAKEFRMDQLQLVQSAEAGHWVHASRSEPPQAGFPAKREEGCVSASQMRQQLSEALDGNICDMEIQRNDSSKAVIAMHCRVAPNQPTFVVPLEMARLSPSHYQVKVALSSTATLVHDYQRTKSCKPGNP